MGIELCVEKGNCRLRLTSSGAKVAQLGLEQDTCLTAFRDAFESVPRTDDRPTTNQIKSFDRRVGLNSYCLKLPT